MVCGTSEWCATYTAQNIKGNMWVFHPTLKRVNSINFAEHFGLQWSGRMLYTTASNHLQKWWNWPYVHNEENHHCGLKYFEQGTLLLHWINNYLSMLKDPLWFIHSLLNKLQCTMEFNINFSQWKSIVNVLGMIWLSLLNTVKLCEHWGISNCWPLNCFVKNLFRLIIKKYKSY